MGPAVQQARPCWSGSHACIFRAERETPHARNVWLPIGFPGNQAQRRVHSTKSHPTKTEKRQRAKHTHTYVVVASVCAEATHVWWFSRETKGKPKPVLRASEKEKRKNHPFHVFSEAKLVRQCVYLCARLQETKSGRMVSSSLPGL